jgi:methyl-accepting chemotaxis protein
MKGSLDNVNKTLQQAEVKKLSQDIQQAADKVSKLAGMSNWNSTLLSLEEGGREFSQTMQTAQKSLGSGKELINNLDQLVQANEKEMIATLKAMQGMLDRSQGFFEGAQQFIQKSDVRFSQLQSRLLAISQSLERTSANLERLTEIVAENPSRLFFGKPPKPRKLKD